jgi:hypothetical protein
MRLRDAFFLIESIPWPQAKDLLLATIDLRIAEIELEETLERHAAADAALRLKQTQYGVGK